LCEAVADLSEQESSPWRFSNEEEDSRIYRGFAEGLRQPYPASAKVFDQMADEEVRHRTMLFDLYRAKFGEYLPLIRRRIQGIHCQEGALADAAAQPRRGAQIREAWNSRPHYSIGMRQKPHATPRCASF